MSQIKEGCSPSGRSQNPRGAGSYDWRQAGIVVFLIVYHLIWNWNRLAVSFEADDMANMGAYFRLAPWRIVSSQFLIWKNFYRPMGAAFYLPLYHSFGLNPAPFQAGLLALTGLNVLLVFFLARQLGCGELSATVAAVIISYHAGLGNLFYNPDMVYDILCFFFFSGALLLYASVRSRGKLLNGWQFAIFLGLYVCALNSKEIAVTMPVVLLAYEWFYYPPVSRSARALGFWMRGQGRTALSAALLNLPYIYGRRIGADAMVNNPAYRPVFTIGRFLDFQKGALHDLLLLSDTPTLPVVFLVWLVVTYLTWRRNRPVLRLCWIYVLLTPLPIAFLVGRFQGCLYIPALGWSVFSAVIFVDIARGASRFLSQEPVCRIAGCRGVLGAVIGLTAFLWLQELRDRQEVQILPAEKLTGVLTAKVIRQMRDLNPHVEPGSRVIFLNDPFQSWDMSFIAMLWFHDRSVAIFNQRLAPMSPAEVAGMDHIFDFQGGQMIQRK